MQQVTEHVPLDRTLHFYANDQSLDQDEVLVFLAAKEQK